MICVLFYHPEAFGHKPSPDARHCSASTESWSARHNCGSAHAKTPDGHPPPPEAEVTVSPSLVPHPGLGVDGHRSALFGVTRLASGRAESCSHSGWTDGTFGVERYTRRGSRKRARYARTRVLGDASQKPTSASTSRTPHTWSVACDLLCFRVR